MHSTSALVSILVPNYNKAPYLRATLDSVLAQTYNNWECIIVDDHSTDTSWEILKEYAANDSRFQVYKRPDNLPKGGNVCRNFAFEISKGGFIQWFDSDDIMSNIMLFSRLEFIHRYNELDFIYLPIVKYFSDDHIEVCRPEKFDFVYMASSFLITVPCWMVQGAFFRRKFLVENKIKWDDRVSILQDVLYGLDVLSVSNKKFEFLDVSDWKWLMHSDGRNVGSKRSDFKNLFSLGYFLRRCKEMFGSQPEFKDVISIGYLEIVRNSQSNFGFIWFYFIVFKLYAFSFQNFFFLFKMFLLVIFYHSLIVIDHRRSSNVRDYAVFQLKRNIRSNRWI